MTLKDISKVLACVALFLLLFFVVGFSFDRSFGLGVLLALFLFWRALKPPHFEPYWVSIQPNWYQLLLDYGLIKDLEEWQQMASRLEHFPAWDYNVLRDGIRFTVLKPDLIYRDDRKNFSRYVKFEENIPEITFYTAAGQWPCQPSLSIDRDVGGYALRISAPDSLQNLQRDEKGHVTAAWLPGEEFSFYREDPGEVNQKRWDKLIASRDKRMRENEWKREETRGWWGRDYPSSIEHKYFTVYHKRI